jgi:hypothetical protein
MNKVEDLKKEKKPFVVNFNLKDSDITDAELLECFKVLPTLPKLGTLNVTFTGNNNLT